MIVPKRLDCLISKQTQLPSSEISIPSSPKVPVTTVFSDENTVPSSPPSSPPCFPWELESNAKESKAASTTTSPVADAASGSKVINAFSILGKRKPLDMRHDENDVSKKMRISQQMPLSQLQISLGQDVNVKCRECGMEYNRTWKDDVRHHNQFHKDVTLGPRVHKKFVSAAPSSNIYTGKLKGDSIVLVTRDEMWSRRKHVEGPLRIVERELGAAPIPKEELWSEYEYPKDEFGMGGNPRYRLLLYVREDRVIGLLLLERITEAYRVIEPTPQAENARIQSASEHPVGDKSAASALRARRLQACAEALTQPIQLAKEAHRTTTGVSRIWVAPGHRRSRLAGAMLNAAVGFMNTFEACIRDMGLGDRGLVERIERPDQIAFSPPTELGAHLARKWVGRQYGWAVYIS